MSWADIYLKTWWGNEGRYQQYINEKVLPSPPAPLDTIPVERNTDIVLSSGYFNMSSSAPSIGFSVGTPREVMSLSKLSRIRQNDEVVQIELGFSSTGVSDAFIDVWRQTSETSWDIIHHIDLSNKFPLAGISTITLDTPIQVLEGDYLGLSGEKSASGAHIYAVLGAEYDDVPYQSGYPVNGNDWSAGPFLTDRVLALKSYSQAPLVVGIGDSIVSGRSLNCSFIETDQVVDLPHQLLYQLSMLNANYIYQNMGISGENTTQIKDRFINDCVNLKPAMAIINGGINDVSSELVDKATTLANYTTMLDYCNNVGIIPVVCRITPWTNFNNDYMIDIDDRMTDLKAIVDTYEGSVWCDFNEAIGEERPTGPPGNLWNYKPGYSSDNVHPTLIGYTAMAEVVNTEISKIYSI